MNGLLNSEGTSVAAPIVSVLLPFAILLYFASRFGAPRRRPAVLSPALADRCHAAVAQAVAPVRDRPVVAVRGIRIRLPVTLH